jgi:hypothetical protein
LTSLKKRMLKLPPQGILVQVRAYLAETICAKNITTIQSARIS